MGWHGHQEERIGFLKTATLDLYRWLLDFDMNGKVAEGALYLDMDGSQALKLVRRSGKRSGKGTFLNSQQTFSEEGLKMSKMMSRRCSIMLALAVAAVLLLPLGVTSASAAETYEFKISLEGIPTHSKNLGVDIFVKELVAKSGGRLKPIVYHSAQLYKDMHVIKAVDMGMVQMAVVGNYLLDGVDINATVTHLPMFFGQAVPEDQYLRFLDEISKPVGRNLEKKIKVKVVGRVFVMGFDNTFTAKKKITNRKRS